MSSSQITIAIDAMGGDYAPLEIVRGAIMAARELDLAIILTGKADEINSILQQEQATKLNIQVVNATDLISMDEKNPARAVKKAANSSVVMANTLVKQGQAQAVIAAGNTGAATAASLFELGRIDGFERPCICTLIPRSESKMFLIDGGSNIDTTPEQMLQSAILGNILAKTLLQIENPKIGLLNIGEEPGKGTDRYKAAYKLLEAEKQINFIGNVEGKTIIDGICDVAICDGFTGNIHLKALEGGLKMMAKAVQIQIKKSGPLALIAGLILKMTGVFDRIKAHFHPSSYGGALLGGLNHISLISHGSSDALAIRNAAYNAKLLVEANIIEVCKKELAQCSQD